MKQTTSEFSTKLIWATPEGEKLISYCARVSNPKNQNNESYENLLRYCIKNKHWSIFSMANMCVEVQTTRAISAQILRHKSMDFQEYSQRYSSVHEFVVPEARLQDVKNRQNSIESTDEELKVWFAEESQKIMENSFDFYDKALERGIAKECARAVLPLNTKSVLYMNGTVRSWIHYLQLRTGNGTQLEHMRIAEDILNTHFKEQFPTIHRLLQTEES